MTAPILRGYQREVIARVEAEITAGQRRILLVAPTGSGKTVVVAAIIANAANARRRVLVVAHRSEIVTQTHAKLYAAGVDAGIVVLLQEWRVRLARGAVRVPGGVHPAAGALAGELEAVDHHRVADPDADGLNAARSRPDAHARGTASEGGAGGGKNRCHRERSDDHSGARGLSHRHKSLLPA